MKNIVMTILLIVTATTIVACGGGDGGDDLNTLPTLTPTAAPTPEPTSEPTLEPTPAPTPEIPSSSLTKVDDFGENPSNLDMHVYVPENLPNMAPILLAVHYCSGDGPTFYRNTQYANMAEQYGFIVIYPTVTRSSKCFDVSSPDALTRDGGSDPVALMSMIQFVQSQYNTDDTRIFVTGVSSGAMMTNVMLALYPEVFNAGAAFAGVPYSCFATNGSSEWNSSCANGTTAKTAQEWGDAVRNANPDYTGEYPRFQLWHGTADEVLNYANFGEAIKQWTNVHGTSQAPVSTETLSNGATLTRYGQDAGAPLVEAYSLEGVSHNLPVNEAAVMAFFGLDTEI
ncbi:extracellular catalytic domain type 1 short-chain-length polyhydroxyalkanoate depolymerase [Teredinibacter haidensis]|uniref:extracellular catalytic domain type 1 short-chain-length polyhydroxyalkanoate depolymerase n=1 Tax=Teredinibacter haidensis TaxID=2731755 RepID=UPI000948D313|nr:PHB depolymerase family esterase [Teredinibacter haidensis]